MVVTVGNHDGLPANFFPYGPLKNSSAQWPNEPLYAEYGSIWGVPKSSEFSDRGYYSLSDPGKCVVSLNSNLYYHFNAFRLMYPDPAPAAKDGCGGAGSDEIGQWLWLIETLSRCHGKAVVVSTHAPIGSRDHSRAYRDALSTILQAFSRHMPIHVLSGHTHTDYFRPWYGRHAHS